MLPCDNSRNIFNHPTVIVVQHGLFMGYASIHYTLIIIITTKLTVDGPAKGGKDWRAGLQ